MAKNKENKKSSQSSKPITDDSRFASVHSDPRFKLPRLNNVKVKVDERFSRKELDKLNAGVGGRKSKIDRYGRKIEEEESRFDKYFKESSSEEGSEEEESEGESEEESEEEESSSDEEVDEKAVSSLDRARGEGLGSDSDTSDSDSESDSDVEDEAESDIELEESKPEEGDPSDTFAVVNMDWDNLRAVDLMATFVSFVPKSGLIKSVTIYPSEFGKEQMQKEETQGPPKELFQKKKLKKDDSDSDSDEEIDTTNAAGLERAAKKLYEEDNGEQDYDSKALRRYQLNRLRYYYAVVKCDSIATAKAIYDSCDGTEFESTANIFDLRYVPSGMDFEDSEAKDVCTKIPSNYKPTLFVTDALQHSKVKLTWDETPKERLNISRLFSQKELEEMDFKAYLASDSDGDDYEEETKASAKDKYKSLLGATVFDRADDDEDVDMEISFNPGLEEQAQKAKAEESKEEEEEDTISAYKRKQKERRKARLEKFKQQKQVEQEPVEETKPKKKRSQAPVDDKSKAELELLMMNENDEQDDNHFSMKDIIKSEKKKNKKKNKEETVQDNFEVDLNDPRFQEIFEDRDYNIDTTSTDFKKTKTMKRILDERSKRLGKHTTKKQKTSSQPSEISSLVDKLKRKSKHSKH